MKTGCGDLFYYQEEKHALMHAASRKHGIQKKSACGIRTPKLAHKMSGFLCFPGDWKSFTKIYGMFRVPENGLWDT